MSRVSQRLKSLKFGDVVAVTWIDAATDHGWARRRGAVKKLKDLEEIITCGFYFYHDKDQIVCTLSVGKKDDYINGLCTVPIGMVTKIEVVRKGFHKELEKHWSKDD